MVVLILEAIGKEFLKSDIKPTSDIPVIAGSSVTHYNLVTGAREERKLPSACIKVDPHASDLSADERDFFIKGSLQYLGKGVIDNDL